MLPGSHSSLGLLTTASGSVVISFGILSQLCQCGVWKSEIFPCLNEPIPDLKMSNWITLRFQPKFDFLGFAPLLSVLGNTYGKEKVIRSFNIL